MPPWSLRMADVTSHTNKRAHEELSFFSGLMQSLRSVFRGRDNDPTLRESLEEFIEDHDNGEALRDEERDMLINILKFGDLRVEDVMVPRADIKAVEEHETLDGLLALLMEAAHSRLPVYRETLDDPIGMVHIKDVVKLMAQHQTRELQDQATAQQPIAQIRREVLFVPPSMPVADLFLKMQATHIHMALVIDEYGGTDGLATIEDLVEEIVGEIEDEHDKDTGPRLKMRTEGGYTADARVEINDLEELLGVDFLPDDREEDIDTLGGLVFSLVGRVPQRGELVTHPLGFDFEVIDADPRRIKRLRIIDNRKSSMHPAAPERKKTSEGA